MPSKQLEAHVEQVRAQAEQDRLRLGVAEAAVELDDARLPGGVDHEPGVEKAAIVDAVGGEAAHGRQHDLAHDSVVHLARDDGRRRIGAHAARVGPEVAVVARLVVLRARERHDARAVDDGDEARFLADEKILDDDRCAGVAELPLPQHAVERLLRPRLASAR